MTSDYEHLKLKFDESDLADCAETLNGEELYCEARVVLWCAARIHELEAELDALKSDLSGYMSAANTYVNELHGVHAGTHVIVPVVADGVIYRAIREVIDDDGSADEVYRAIIRTAQPDTSD